MVLQLLKQQHQIQIYEDNLISTCKDFAQQVEAALASPSFELKQDVIRLLIEHIVIKHIVPAEDDYRLCRLKPTRLTP